MASINLNNKSKADLVELVRMSGIMPVSRAQRMTKANLIIQLESLNGNSKDQLEPKDTPTKQASEEEILLMSAPGKLAARKLNEDKKTNRRARTGERRSSVLLASEEIQPEEVKATPRRSVMATVVEEELVAPPRPTKSILNPIEEKPSPVEEKSSPIEEKPSPVEESPSPEIVKAEAKVRKNRRKPAVSKEETISPVTISEERKEVLETVETAPQVAEDKPLEQAPEKIAETSTSRARSIDKRSRPTTSNTRRPRSSVKTETSDTAAKKIPPNEKESAEALASEKNSVETVSTDKTDSTRDTNRNPRNINRNQLKRQRNQRHPQSGQDLKNDSNKATVEDANNTPTAPTTPNLQAKINETQLPQENSDLVVAKEKAERQNFDSGEIVSGVMEIMPDGYGFLRRENYLQGPHDVYLPPQFIRRFNLRAGDFITGPTRIQREQDRYQALYFIKTVNGVAPEQVMKRANFDRLTPIYPDKRFKLETTKSELSTRIIDLIAPIGKGQRGMIVSPPKAGKTILLQKIANAISINNPDAKLIVLLIDERPEEVTDMQRSIKGEVVFSTFDKTPENHVKITELVLERALRLVEMGEDVIILMDSLTRMARAYNLTINPTGRTLSGGLDPGALYGPKRFFGAARNIENGGSLTIVATALIDTGSRMDEVIFEEFKGTGNMEVYLDRKLSEKRIFPAIDINRSGTRREELLLTEQELEAIWSIRKAFGQLDSSNVTETIMNLLMKTNDNQHFVSSINVSLNNRSLYDTMKPSGGRNGQ